MHLGMPECHKPFLGHCDLDLWPSFQEFMCPEHISYIIWCRNPNMGLWFLLGWRSGAYHFESLWPWHWLLASFLGFSCYITAFFPQMCLMLDQFLWGHSSRVCDISCSDVHVQWAVILQHLFFRCSCTISCYFTTFIFQMFMYNELLFYNMKKNDWLKVTAPNSPPPRSAHQVTGRIQDFWKGGSYEKRGGGSLCWFYLIFLKYPVKMKWFGLILSTFIKLPLVIKIFVMSIFEWPFYTSFTIFRTRILKQTCFWVSPSIMNMQKKHGNPPNHLKIP